MINITDIRHAWPEPAGFLMSRTNGHPEYTFLHFFNSVSIEYKGSVIKTQPHAVILFDINTPQFFESPEPLVHDWIHFTLSSPFDFGFLTDTIYYPSHSDFITDMIRELEAEFFDSRSRRREYMEIKVRELFLKLSREIASNGEMGINLETKEKLRYLRGHMFSHLRENWTVKRMADEVGLSQSRFFTVYKSFYGISPVSDLIRARMNSAKNMLLYSGRRIEEIAELLGYQNITHFIRQFKKENGMSPSAYRKVNRST